MPEWKHPPDLSPLAPTGRAPGLVVAGALMLGVTLILDNPGFGIDHEAWPWAPEAGHPHDLRADVVRALWAITGLWCLVLGLTRQVTARAYVAAGLAGLLLLETGRGLAPLANTQLPLKLLLPLALLGGGLRLAGNPVTGRLGATWAGAGGAWTLWALASAFPGPEARPSVVRVVEEAGAFVAAPADSMGPDAPLWQVVVPLACFSLAALFGVLAWLGLRGRGWCQTAFALLVVGVLAPGVAHGVGAVDAMAEVTTHGVLAALVRALVGLGALVLWLGAFVVADLGRARERDARADASVDAMPSGARLATPRMLLVLGFLVLAGLTLACFNPDGGAVVEAWPHAVLAAGAWRPEAMLAGTYLALLGMLLVAVFLRDVRRRGLLVVFATGLALIASAPTTGRVHDAWLLPLAAALVAGLLMGRGRGVVARGPLLAALIVLAGLLFMPWGARQRPPRVLPGGYASTATVHVEEIRRGTQQITVAAPRAPHAAPRKLVFTLSGRTTLAAWWLPTLAGLLLLGIGVLSLATTAGWARGVALLALLLLAGGPIGALLASGAGRPEPADLDAWARGIRWFGLLAPSCGAAWALILAAGAADRRPRRIP